MCMLHSGTVGVEVDTPTLLNGSLKLSCEVYGYLRSSSHPVWTAGNDVVQNDERHKVTVENVYLLSYYRRVSLLKRVVSHLTIIKVTNQDLGDYTCSIQGNSSRVTVSNFENGRNTHCLC